MPQGLDFPGRVATTKVSGKPGNAALSAEWPLAQRWDFVEQWKLRPETQVQTGRERARLVKCVGDIVWRLNAASRLVCELASSARHTIHSIENSAPCFVFCGKTTAAVFRNLSQPWTSHLCLNFAAGPPGTGKTSLCRALAQKLTIRLSSRCVGDWREGKVPAFHLQPWELSLFVSRFTQTAGPSVGVNRPVPLSSASS